MVKTLQILTHSLLLLLVLSAYAPATHAASADDIRAALERELAELDAEAAAAAQTNTEPESRPEFNISRENYDNPVIEIETSMGLIIIELFPNEAPATVRNFLALSEGSKPFTDPQTGELVTRPFYDGLIFHRIVDGFMIQGGSPTGLGDGGPGYTFNDEINARSLGLDKMLVLDDDGYPHPLLGVSDQADFQQKVLSPLYQEMDIDSPEGIEANVDAIEARLRNMTVKQNLESLGYEYSERFISRNPVRGVLAMANSGPNSNGSQFFITLADTDWLTGRHTIFGRVRAGMDVVERISKVRVDAQSRPYRAVSIISIKPFED